MNDICVPIPRLEERQVAEVEVKVEGEKRMFNFRVESFPWEAKAELLEGKDHIPASELRIQTLKDMIESYDKNWELIQIYNPKPRAKFIQALFRQRI